MPGKIPFLQVGDTFMSQKVFVKLGLERVAVIVINGFQSKC